LSEKYGAVTRHDGDVLPFLSMDLDFTAGGVVRISMPAYLDEIIKDSGVTSSKPTPASAHLFEVDGDSPLLCAEDAHVFHSRVAKLLYLAKRTRVDILLPVNFLCTRVKAPTEEDRWKLARVCRYLLGTRHLSLNLGVGSDYVFTMYADASYAVHLDRRSHSGSVLSLGYGVISGKSTKQQIVTKSSTEAELVKRIAS